jgi:hypothetical protein
VQETKIVISGSKVISEDLKSDIIMKTTVFVEPFIHFEIGKTEARQRVSFPKTPNE